MQPYLLDSNFFIEAHRTTYPLDVMQSFWWKVEELALKGMIRSIDKVKAEIYDSEDALAHWMREKLPEDFFIDSVSVIKQYKSVVNWAVSMAYHYTPAAIAQFLEAERADAWLVAHGMQRGCIIVTQEVSQPQMKREIRIPEPCDHFTVKYLNTIKMFREAGIKI